MIQKEGIQQLAFTTKPKYTIYLLYTLLALYTYKSKSNVPLITD